MSSSKSIPGQQLQSPMSQSSQVSSTGQAPSSQLDVPDTSSASHENTDQENLFTDLAPVSDTSRHKSQPSSDSTLPFQHPTDPQPPRRPILLRGKRQPGQTVQIAHPQPPGTDSDSGTALSSVSNGSLGLSGNGKGLGLLSMGSHGEDEQEVDRRRKNRFEKFEKHEQDLEKGMGQIERGAKTALGRLWGKRNGLGFGMSGKKSGRCFASYVIRNCWR